MNLLSVLLQQPEIIRNAVRHMHKPTNICVEPNGGDFEKQINRHHLIVQLFLLNCFDKGKMKVLPLFMFNSFKLPDV